MSLWHNHGIGIYQFQTHQDKQYQLPHIVRLQQGILYAFPRHALRIAWFFLRVIPSNFNRLKIAVVELQNEQKSLLECCHYGYR